MFGLARELTDVSLEGDPGDVAGQIARDSFMSVVFESSTDPGSARLDVREFYRENGEVPRSHSKGEDVKFRSHKVDFNEDDFKSAAKHRPSLKNVVTDVFELWDIPDVGGQKQELPVSPQAMRNLGFTEPMISATEYVLDETGPYQNTFETTYISDDGVHPRTFASMADYIDSDLDSWKGPFDKYSVDEVRDDLVDYLEQNGVRTDEGWHSEQEFEQYLSSLENNASGFDEGIN